MIYTETMRFFQVFFVCLSCLPILPAVSTVYDSTFDHIRSLSSDSEQNKAVKDLIQRKIGSRASEFVVNVTSTKVGKDSFKLRTNAGKVYITGSSGYAAAWGFYYYLSQYCGCHISWAGDQLRLPTVLPTLSDEVVIVANDRFRYYQNVCTVSYSSVWWDWPRWEREIDWMAMNGINLPLAFTGQEAIWKRVLLKMGFTNQELDNHFGGVAFLAWSRMGNMHGWGGPLPDSWHQRRLTLQHQILTRMRAFGMTPVLPAFGGYVPDAISRVFPKANVTKMRAWGHFDDPYCCTKLLNVEDPLFATIGREFLSEYISEFGTNHIYNTDTFNENRPASGDVTYLHRAGQAVYDSMIAGDKLAVWLMQGWLFANDEEFWQPTQAEALLTSVPRGRLIILDLSSDIRPQYQRLNSYFGQPFIWCMINNFGGTLSMYGTIESVNKGPSAARAMINSTMIGIGLTMEGINQNNVMYEFMLENGWRQRPRNVSEWIRNYTRRRYGTYSTDVEQAWQILKTGVYNCTNREYFSHGIEIVTSRPSYEHPISPYVWYSVNDFFIAWDHFLNASGQLSGSSLYRYDLVDVTRQAMQLISMLFYNQTILHYHHKDYHLFRYYSEKLLTLLLDVDWLLSTDEHFLLGRWLEAAKSMSMAEDERRLYEYNARNQITLWRPDGNILDYANKQWSGLVKAYYYPRWKLFVNELERQWNTSFNQDLFNIEVFTTVEQPFTFDRTPFPTTPSGDQITVATAIHQRYRPIIYQHSSFFQSLMSQKSTRSRKFRASSDQPTSADWTWVL